MLRAIERRGSAGREPRLHLCQIPYDASRRQSKPARELPALLHLVDSAVGQRDYCAQLFPSDRPRDRILSRPSHSLSPSSIVPR